MCSHIGRMICSSRDIPMPFKLKFVGGQPVPSILVILGPFSFKIKTSGGSVLQRRPALAIGQEKQ